MNVMAVQLQLQYADAFDHMNKNAALQWVDPGKRTLETGTQFRVTFSTLAPFSTEVGRATSPLSEVTVNF